MALDYKAIDVDNHYYEPMDSFTRHLPKEFKRRGVQMVTDGKRTLAVMGERVNHFIPNPTFDPIIEPGCLDLLFRGEIPEGVDPASLMKVDRLENHPEYQNRDARVKVLDTQNLETVFMLPTFACGVEEALKHDIEATMASVHAFNHWLDEDWGFDRPDHRIISAPIISLADPEKAVEEVEFVLGRGAKLVLVRPAPVPGVVKPRSLGDPVHDPVWARLAEAGVPVGFHLSDSGYLAIAALWGGKATFEGFGEKDPLDQVLLDDRAIHDTMASMIVHQVFTRHPKLKAVSIENGSYFVHRLIKRLKKAANTAPHHFVEDPVEQLRNNVWIAPYYEDDLPSCSPTPSASTRSCSGRTGRTARASRSPMLVHRRIRVPRVQRRRHPQDHAGQRLGPARRQGRVAGLAAKPMSEWTIGAVLDAIAEVIPDRMMTVCGDSAQHVRRVGGPHTAARELPCRQGLWRHQRAGRTGALGVRPGPRRADHAQRPVSRHGGRLPQGAHRPGQRQPSLHAARDRRTARLRQASGGHLPPVTGREVRRRAAARRGRSVDLDRRRQRRRRNFPARSRWKTLWRKAIRTRT